MDSSESDTPEMPGQHSLSTVENSNNSKVSEKRKSDQNEDDNGREKISFKVLVDQHDADEDFVTKKKRGRPSKSKKVVKNSSMSSMSNSSTVIAAADSPRTMFSTTSNFSPVVVGRSLVASPKQLPRTISSPDSGTSSGQTISDDKDDDFKVDEDITKSNNMLKMFNSTTRDKMEMDSYVEEINDDSSEAVLQVSDVCSLASSSVSDAFPALGVSGNNRDEVKSEKTSFPGSDSKPMRIVTLGLTHGEGTYVKDEPRTVQALQPLPPKVFKPVGPRLQQPIRGNMVSRVSGNKYIGDNSKASHKQVGVTTFKITEVNKKGSLDGVESRNLSDGTRKSNPCFSQQSMIQVNRTPSKQPPKQNQVSLPNEHCNLTPPGLGVLRPNMPGVMPRRFAPQPDGNQRKLGVPPPIRRSVVGRNFVARIPSPKPRPSFPGGNISLSQQNLLKRTNTYPPRFVCNEVVAAPVWSPPPGISLTRVSTSSNKECFSPSISLPSLAKALSQLGNTDGQKRIAKFNLTEVQIKALDVLGVKEELDNY